MEHVRENGQKNILLIMERDNFKRDAQLMEILGTALQNIDYELVWYSPYGTEQVPVLDTKKRMAILPLWLQKIIKTCMLLGYPRYWNYYFVLRPRENTVRGRCKNLKHYIQSLDADTNVIILSRSAGGRISSLVADELGIKKLICLGYPFKHPDHSAEPERYQHFAFLETPFLILQGTSDSYGGKEIAHAYQLSPQVSLEFVDTDHDFRISLSQWDTVLGRIKQFIAQEEKE